MAFNIIRAVVYVAAGFFFLYQGLMLLCGVGRLAKRDWETLDKKGKDGRHFMRSQGAILQLFGVALFAGSVLPFFAQAEAVSNVVTAILLILIAIYTVRNKIYVGVFF